MTHYGSMKHHSSPGFHYTFELLPARAATGKALDELLLFAERAAKDRILSALSITDNAGGHPALTPLALGREIAATGMKPVIHFSCKDKNRNTLESQLLALARQKLTTLLVLTGDYPHRGYRGRAKPVFDLDSVQALNLIDEMNKGLRQPDDSASALRAGMFTAGCVVSPFKATEAETVGQYLKLAKKIASGASFIISQMGFDLRKFHELLLVTRSMAGDIPIHATVFMPDFRLAGMIRRGMIPGCTMPERLLGLMERDEQESPAIARDSRIMRAAKLAAALRGIGYDGVHFSGCGLEYDDVIETVQQAESMAPEWQRYVHEFLFPEEWKWWLFEKDNITGLNRMPQTGTKVLDMLRNLPGRRISIAGHAKKTLNQVFHNLFFTRDSGAYAICRHLAEYIDRSSARDSFASAEYVVKGLFYDCRHCGDCALGDNAFICPQSQCAKFLLNGPCGGSRDGWCEVWPGKKRCIYVRVYERIIRTSDTKSLGGDAVQPRDWSLNETSSWINFYLERDHSGRG